MDTLAPTITMLIQLYLVSVVLTIALEQVFDNDLYRKVLGKEDNSMIGAKIDFRPYIATAVGILIAAAAQLEFLSRGLGIDMTSGWMSKWGMWVDWVLTGCLLGGGAKTVKKLANGISSAREEIADAASVARQEVKADASVARMEVKEDAAVARRAVKVDAAVASQEVIKQQSQ